MEQHPEVGDPVALRDPAGREHASRVQDLGNGLLVVARPRDLSADDGIGSGTDVTVTWADADGVVLELPTRILAVHGNESSPVWSLAVTGPAYTQQRRRFERVPVAGPVTIRGTAVEPAHVVRGSLLDVGEGGVRCAIPTGAADRFLMGPNQVVAEFRLDTTDYSLPGRVEFLRPTKNPTQVEELVVVFDQPVAEAASLRKQVFAREVKSLEGPGSGSADDVQDPPTPDGADAPS